MRTDGPSLRAGFAWTFAGNAINGFSQWAILSLIAKLSNTETLGSYALAVAVSTPVAMLAHLNLRSVLTTDVGGLHSFADYYSVRVWAGIAGIVLTTAIGLCWNPFWPVGCTIVLVGCALNLENFQDLWHAVMQRDERLDTIAKSMILRSTLSLSFVSAALLFRPGPVSAGVGLLASRLLTLTLFDRRVRPAITGSPRNSLAVLRSALPLGLGLMLVSLTSAIPRYAVEKQLGTAALGAFAAVSSFITIGSVIMNALGQSATTRLARAFQAGSFGAFRSLAFRLAALALGVGIGGTLLAAAFGDTVLRVVYRPELGQYRNLLVAVLLAGTAVYLSIICGFVVTSTRQFRQQLPLLAIAAAVSAAVSFTAVPGMGLTGAAVALGAAALVQIGGQLTILRKAL